MNKIKQICLTLAATAIAATSLLGNAGLAGAEPSEPDKIVRAQVGGSGNTTSGGQPLPALRQLERRGAMPIAAMSQPAAAPYILKPKPECPAELMAKCRFVPAAYQQNSDQWDYGNYSQSNRPANGLKINTIVQHVTEGSLADTLAVFQDPLWYASAHYVIDTDGTIYQMVQNKNVAWHAGNWYVNEHSIGIEHVGFAAEGRTSFTPAMYRSSALLSKWLAQKYQIPLDRQHILGHDNVQAPIAALVPGMHWEPAAFWNWQHFMNLLDNSVQATSGSNSSLITIAPNWSTNQPPVSDCRSGTCTDLPKQPTNFLYLRTQPNDTAPLLTDSALTPRGTTRIDDWSDKATYGQQFAVAQHQGQWVGIWYGNQIGWFKNPRSQPTAHPTKGKYITPKANLTSISVYGRAYPEAGAYSGTPVPVQAVVPLQYTIGAGQKYATTGTVPADYYYGGSFGGSEPGDRTVIIGGDRYLEIQYNHRVAYVKQNDVAVSNN